ncbi:hypothetical protein T484DRAFT_1900183 [Baffinella frigidus]|nr:hypothetical protein T484DRAFT_1900183 [Cryptophyta sp. CCMP2293]
MSATVETVYGIPSISDEEKLEEDRLDELKTKARSCAALTSATLLILLLIALHLNANNAAPARLLEMAISRRSEMSLLEMSASQEAVRASLDPGASSLDQQLETDRREKQHLAAKHRQARAALTGSLASEVDSALSDTVSALPRQVHEARAEPRGCGATGPCHTGLDKLDDVLVPVGSGTEGGRDSSAEAPQHQALAAAAFPPGGARLHLQGSSLAGELNGVMSDNVAVLPRRRQGESVVGCSATGSCDDDLLVTLVRAEVGARRPT